MKILYHHRTASRDGQSTHIEEMIRGLRSIGCVIDEASPAMGKDDPSGGSAGWVGKLKAYLPSSIYELAEVAYSLVAYRRLKRKIREFKPDGIYERYNLYLLAGVWAKKRYGIPLVLEVNAPMALERRQYGGISWPRLADWAERYVWRNADIVLPVTQVLADYIVAQGVPRERILVIPNGINKDHYRNLPSTEEAKSKLALKGKLVIGFTGFVREWDRLDRIVRWIARQPVEVGAHLLVIGDGPARSDIESCASALGVRNRLTFTGVVRREEVPALAMAFDIALQTALVPYASPLCLFEYLALAKAIVAPDQPNHHEILMDRVDCVLYDPESESGIERALDALCADSSLRERVGLQALAVVDRKKLTWNHHAGTVASLFARLTSVPLPPIPDTR
jgi:glycosyltransferase involved in cell wall biosynthesis